MSPSLQQAFQQFAELPAPLQNDVAAYLQKHKDDILKQASKEKALQTPQTESDTQQKIDPKLDPWSNPDLPLTTAQTGLSDMAANHDHYAWGTPKKHNHE